ncbi:MAG: DUF418 domain-containing protein, partial [Blastocatellia bacterium]|nr:DUF418 domain-containing protein [Blastocatellia bacterium]
MSTHSAQTTTLAERIATLDILRGFALLGMIIVHFHQRFRLSWPAEDRVGLPGEWLVGWTAWWGLEQKSWAAFAFLFGVGFAIFMRRAEAHSRPLVTLYLRRLGVLALIGIAVEALTGFAILLHYAIWGVPLLFVRRWSTRVLLVLAVISAMAWPAYRFGVGVHEWLTRDQAATVAAAPPAVSARAAPPDTYTEVVTRRLGNIQRGVLSWRVLIPGSSFVLFILGFIALRHGVFDEPKRHLRLIVTAMVVGLACWLIFWFGLQKMPSAWTDWSDNAWPLRYGLGVISEQWLAFTYMGAIVLLLAYRPWWTERLAILGVVGRMALTNYVLQAIAIDLLSSRFGFALKLRPYYYGASALLLFAALAVVSYIWL